MTVDENEIISRAREKKPEIINAAEEKGINLIALAEGIKAIPGNERKKGGRLASQLIQVVKEAFMTHAHDVAILGNYDRFKSGMPIKVHMVPANPSQPIIEVSTWGLSTKINGQKDKFLTFPSRAGDVVMERSKNIKFDSLNLVALNEWTELTTEKARSVLVSRVMSRDQLAAIALNDIGDKATYIPVIFAAAINEIQAERDFKERGEDGESTGSGGEAEYYPLIGNDARDPPEAHPCFTARGVLSGAPKTYVNMHLAAPRYSEPWTDFEEPLIEKDQDGGLIGGMVLEAVEDADGNPVRAAKILSDDLTGTPVVVMGTITRWDNTDRGESLHVSVSAMIETRALIAPGNKGVQSSLKGYEREEEPPARAPEKVPPKRSPKPEIPEPPEDAEERKGFNLPPEDDDEAFAAEISEEVAKAPPTPPVVRKKTGKDAFMDGAKAKASEISEMRTKRIRTAINAVMVATRKFVTDIPEDGLLTAVQKQVSDATLDEVRAAAATFQKSG